jgi:hypothetical protein
MYRKLSPFIVLLAAVNILFVGSISAQKNSADGVWRKLDDAALAQRESAQKWANPVRFESFRINRTALEGILKRAPQEFSEAARGVETVLTIPLPNGGFERFRIEDSPIMEAALAAKYPEIQSYRGQGIDNPTATIRFDVSPNGFRAQILSNQGTIFVEPAAIGDTENYISFYKSDVPRSADGFSCLIGEDLLPQTEQLSFVPQAPAVTNGTQLRTYRLALAATGEYTNVFRQAGDTDVQAKTRALAQMNTTMNRVNQVYERDLAIRMVIVANTDLVIYTDGTSDPYTNNSGSTMLSENQTNLDNVIGTANYDIGHVFSTGGGGIATLNSPCNPNSKARGVTGLPNPTGDIFAIDYVAHEIGHQFGARHTFNGTVNNCSGSNRSSVASYEPGSGITIMAYAGICGNQNLAFSSIDTFHVKSLEEIVAFVSNFGTCSLNTPTGNTPPSINSVGGTSWNIPKQTPFSLTAAATDANGDTVTYDWQQYDLGGASGGTSAVPNTDSDGVARPIFRVYSPVSSGTRSFPSSQFIRNNANVPPNTTSGFLTGELLPAITRTMNFQAIARDNRAGGGAINTVTVQVNVDGNSGPFNVTAPNTAVNWTGNTQQTVTWNVANTNAAPVNAATVRILLSTDGGLTFPTIVSNGTPNDGSETINVPNIATTQARIRIEAANNIFFDISDVNFTITQGVASARKLYDFDGDGRSDIAVFRPSDGGWYLLRSQAGFTGLQFGIATDKAVAGDFDGDGKTDVAVFRNGFWFWLNSSNGAFNAVQFGTAGDQPMAGDFDGDGKNDPTVFRNGIWYILQSSDGAFNAAQFGAAGDKPVTGDYDGDNKSDIAVFRPSDGGWYLLRSQLGFAGLQFGISTDAPAPADFDGDGKTDVAVFRSGTWYLLRSQLGFAAAQFGAASDTPAPADYDGDNKADIAVFRPSNGTWYQLGSTSGFSGVQFGANGDTAVSAPLY